jgi:hypothetical protein
VARNQVQFQRGLSTVEFQELYGREEQCRVALVRMRWPGGFLCPKCGGRAHAYCEPRHLFQCRACRTQTSARAGTIFHKSRTPLAKWFLAMHLITASKNDIAALELARQLDVKWDTRWLMKQKLLGVMLQRNSMYKLAGDIQVDDAYQGGKKAGKPGRGAANKLPFVIAVATRDGHPIYTHLRVVSGSRLTDCSVKTSIVADGCYLDRCRIEDSVIGIRTHIRPGAQNGRSVLLGSDDYEDGDNYKQDEYCEWSDSQTDDSGAKICEFHSNFNPKRLNATSQATPHFLSSGAPGHNSTNSLEAAVGSVVTMTALKASPRFS